MINQLNPARGDPESEDSILILSMWIFTVLTALYGNSKTIRA